MSTERLNLFGSEKKNLSKAFDKKEDVLNKKIYLKFDNGKVSEMYLTEVIDSVITEVGCLEELFSKVEGLPKDVSVYSESYKYNMNLVCNFLIDNGLADCLKNTLGLSDDDVSKRDFTRICGWYRKHTYLNTYCLNKFGDRVYLDIMNVDLGDKADVEIVGDSIYFTGTYFDFVVENFTEIKDIERRCATKEDFVLRIGEHACILLDALARINYKFEDYKNISSYYFEEIGKLKVTEERTNLSIFFVDGENKFKIKNEELLDMMVNEIRVEYVEHTVSLTLLRITESKMNMFTGKTLGIEGINRLVNSLHKSNSFSVLSKTDVLILKLVGGIAVNTDDDDVSCELCYTGKYMFNAKSFKHRFWGKFCPMDFIEMESTLGEGLGQLMLPINHKYAELLG